MNGKIAATALATALICACAAGSNRVQTLQRGRAFQANILAVAAARGGGDRGGEVSRALVRRLEGARLKAAELNSSDSVLAGTEIGIDNAADPRVLAEVRRATAAEGVVFLDLDPMRSRLEIVVLDARSGELVLRAKVRPRGERFTGPEEAAAGAVAALTGLYRGKHDAAREREAGSEEEDDPDEISVP